jgi:hypothetical protein
LLLASVILAITFYLPVGGERRRSQTKYKSLEGFSGIFQVHQDSAPVHVESRPSPAVVQSVVPNRINQTEGLKPGAVMGKRTRGRARNRLKDAMADSPRQSAVLKQLAPSVDASTVNATTTAAVEKVSPVITPVVSRPVTFDSVAEDYDNDPSKYPMERNVVQGPITLSLCGLSRSKSPIILKVAVTNQGGEDFFIKELTVRDGPHFLASKFYVRLFVEPGRTREAYITFDRPHAGADVHVALKEDRENGRVVELAVPYSF